MSGFSGGGTQRDQVISELLQLAQFVSGPEFSQRLTELRDAKNQHDAAAQASKDLAEQYTKDRAKHDAEMGEREATVSERERKLEAAQRAHDVKVAKLKRALE